MSKKPQEFIFHPRNKIIAQSLLYEVDVKYYFTATTQENLSLNLNSILKRERDEEKMR